MTRFLPLTAGAFFLAASPAPADVIDIPTDKDNTLYQHPLDELSNGSGEYMFAGVTAVFEPRRALIHFDLGAIPRGSTIDSVTLTLEMNMTIVGAQVFDLHRVIADWGEGASDAPGMEGAGGDPMQGDATWLNAFYPDCAWQSPGGDFDPIPSASAVIGGLANVYTFTDPAMAADLQAWLDGTQPNHGWLIKHTDEVSISAKRFSTRENAIVASRPYITVDFTPANGCTSQNYCGPAVANSSGVPAAISFFGSCRVSDAAFHVKASQLPPGQFGYFLTSMDQGFFMPPSSQGNVCLGGNIGRFVAQIQNSGPCGNFDIQVDLSALPVNPATPVLPGDSWNFQCWYRDVGNTNNFTDGIEVSFE